MSPRIRLKGATQFRGKLSGLLAREIRRARSAAGLNQQQAAKECEVTLERYVDIEDGLAVTANLSTMDRIAAVLGLDWDDVFVKRKEDRC
jgi:DNA-binding XRE family transcriptional regulator